MGLLENISRILLVAKADTSNAERNIKKLEGKQREAAKGALEAQEKTNASLERSIIKLGKVAIGVGVAVTAWKGLSAAADFYAKRQRLAAASVGADYGAIQAAANGLITKTEAMQLAAAAMNTEFALSQDKMESVAQFMIVLRNQGNDLADVQKRVTQAIVEGNTEALVPFGIFVKEATHTLDAQNAILREVEKQNLKYANSMDIAGDASRRFAVAMQDSRDAAKSFFGEAKENIDQFLFTISGLEYSQGIDKEVALHNRLFRQNRREMAAQQKIVDELERQAVARHAEITVLINADYLEENLGIPYARDVSSPIAKLLLDPTGQEFTKLGNRLTELARAAQKLAAQRTVKRRKHHGGGRATVEDILTPEQRAALKELLALLDDARNIGIGPGGGAIDRETLARAAPPPAPVDPELIRQMALQVEQLTAQRYLTDQLRESYTALGEVMVSTATAGFDAWITGAESVGDAMKKAFAEGIRGLANDMFANSLREGAMALAALATGNGPAAAMHGKAAAAFGAGALAAGGIAKAMGAGGTTHAGGAPGAGARAPTPGSGNTREVIIIGQDTMDDDVRGKRRRVRELLDRADAELGSGGQVQRV